MPLVDRSLAPKPTRKIAQKFFCHICIIVAVKIIVLITLWYHFFSTPVAHDMTVHTDKMNQHFLDKNPAH